MVFDGMSMIRDDDLPKGERHDGLGARAHNDALHPEPEHHIPVGVLGRAMQGFHKILCFLF